MILTVFALAGWLALAAEAREDTDAAAVPLALLQDRLQADIDRGVGGAFPSAGCVGLLVGIDSQGEPRDVRIFKSSRILQIDRGLLAAVSRYRFRPPREESLASDSDQRWRVYVNYNQRGTRYQIAPACAPLRDDDGAYPERREDGSL